MQEKKSEEAGKNYLKANENKKTHNILVNI